MLRRTAWLRGRAAFVRVLVAVALPLLPLGAGSVARAGEGGWHADYFPNVKLTTHEGKTVRFYDDVIRDKVVLINFIYTKCGDVCPLDTAQLLEVQKLLGARVGKDIFMYSISLDSKNDTSETLKRYMHSFGIGPGWTFLTGSSADVALLQKKLGLRPPSEGKLREHDTRMIIGNEKTSSWIKRTPYDDPQILANLLGVAMSNYAGATAGPLKAYRNVHPIEGVTPGNYLFRTRCDACHTIGQGDKLGPDLNGVVAARPEAWLRRWLREPDKMLAEKDPVALKLQTRFRGLPMPNLSLTDTDAIAVIDYMKQEDERLRSTAKPKVKQK